MSNDDALEILRKEQMCCNTYVCPSRTCSRCPYYVEGVRRTEALNKAILALEMCVIVEGEG